MKALWGALLAACVFLAGCGGDAAEKHSRNFFAMDTYMTITAYGSHAEEGMKEAEAHIRTLEDELSVTKEGSDVCLLSTPRYKDTLIFLHPKYPPIDINEGWY